MKRPRLILHIGTHKTGTTGIQKFCASNRDALLKQGILYPSYSLIREKEHYAHHHLAHGLAGQDQTWTQEKISTFFAAVAKNCPADGQVLISAEPLYRHVIQAKEGKQVGNLGDNDYWNGRGQYIEMVARCLEDFDVEVVAVFRKQPDFFNSLYQEMIKATRFRGSVFEFFLMKRHEFNYFAQIEAWSAHFPKTRAFVFEELAADNNLVHNFLNVVTGRRLQLPEITAHANTSLHPVIVEIKRLINSLPGSVSRTPVARVEAGALQKLQAYAVKHDIISQDRQQSYLSASESRLLSISCRHGNRQMRRKYFPDGSRELEQTDTNKGSSDASHELSPALVAHLVAKLADIIKTDAS